MKEDSCCSDKEWERGNSAKLSSFVALDSKEMLILTFIILCTYKTTTSTS